tara:strand:+ start:1725 stop:1847 length:123 start_codon:yes stop_codon:yes gene_type:complete
MAKKINPPSNPNPPIVRHPEPPKPGSKGMPRTPNTRPPKK